MKKKTKHNATPEEILRNLRDMIDEAEDVLAESSGEEQEERLSILKERIQEGFGRLREYSSEFGGRVKGYYSGVGGRMKDYCSDAEDRLRDAYEEVEDRLRDRVEDTDRALRGHPYQMATVTFGLGIAIGALLRLAGRSR